MRAGKIESQDLGLTQYPFFATLQAPGKPMSTLQNHLLVHGLGTWLDYFGISTKRHPKYANLVQFKYSQIESPMGNPIVQESRGIILDESTDWQPVCRPFDKFFNVGETHAAELHWPSSRVYEKIDRSLLSLWWNPYSEQWEVSTTGTPDAGGLVYGAQFTFADLFWKTWSDSGYRSDSDLLDTEVTYMFELTSPWNRIVVPHDHASITLLGARHQLGQELVIEDLDLPFKKVKTFDLSDLDSLLSTFDSFRGLHQEGYVVRDAEFNRVKVKHPEYLQLHRAIDGLSPRTLLEIVRKGETSEVLAYFPEWVNLMDRIQTRFDGVVADLENIYADVRHIADQKTFALRVKDHPFSGALFQIRRQGTSFREYLADMNIYQLADRIKLHELVTL